MSSIVTQKLCGGCGLRLPDTQRDKGDSEQYCRFSLAKLQLRLAQASSSLTSFIKFVKLKAKLNIYPGESDSSPREMVTAMVADSPVPFFHFRSHRTSAVLITACIPVGSMTS